MEAAALPMRKAKLKIMLLCRLSGAVIRPAVTVYHSSLFAAHATPAWHPDSPARTQPSVLDTVIEAIGSQRIILSEMTSLHAHVADGSALKRVHTAEYLSMLAEPMGPKEMRRLDADTFISRASWNVTRLAASAWLCAVDDACSRHRGTTFALTRPPGHHAGASNACGFCTINSAAVATFYALSMCDRVALLDLDVHFGNGCASIIGSDPSLSGRVRYCSIHQHPAFPYSGGMGEERTFDKVRRADTLCFLPLAPGTSGPEWLARLREKALPFLEALDPQLLVVSAGFDGLVSDHLAQFELVAADYRAAGVAIRRVFPDIPVAAGLEGGYDTAALPWAIAAFLDGILTFD